MGYTHYWNRAADGFSDEEWNAIKMNFHKILHDTEVLLARNSNAGETVEVSDDQIWFNGVGEDGHETMALSHSLEGFQFCKTARKPYDEVVTALLALAAHVAPDTITVSSDGDPEDWDKGLELARKATGLSIECPLKEVPEEA